MLSIDAIERELLSPATQEFVRARAARVEGGYLRITTSLVKRLPVGNG